MSNEIGIEEIALLIKPLGDGRIQTCIYKDPENILEDNELDLAIQVAVTMSAFFELVADEEDEEASMMKVLKDKLERKVHEIMTEDLLDYEEQTLPLYTAEGNILKINRFTKTKGSC